MIKKKEKNNKNNNNLLLHEVTLPDHLPFALHERKEDPAIRYPVSQVREAWEPNEDPHEKEAMEPLMGCLRSGHDIPVDKYVLLY